MKNLITLFILVVFGPGLLGQTYYGPNYVHLNHASNCFGDYTILDGSIVGTNPADNLIFTHVYGMPDFTHQAYMPHSHGLWYTGTEWSIFNEIELDMDTSLAFNVLNPQINGTSFMHTVTVANSISNWSDIDNPLLNNNPTAVFFISKSWANDVYDTHHIGIWYDIGNSKWSVYNELAAAPLEINGTYNIFVPDAATSFYKHVANSSNTSGSYITYLDNPLLNGNPDAKIFVVHDYTNNSGNTGYINGELGVWYDTGNSKWTIYDDNFTSYGDTLYNGATFNVLILRDNPVGIANIFSDAVKIKVTPNPAKDKVTVLLNASCLKSLKEIRISSIDGQTVLHQGYNGDAGEQIVFDLSSVSQGLYVLTAVTGEGILSTKVNIVR
jgi:Secretion system C-terminal sorting domain